MRKDIYPPLYDQIRQAVVILKQGGVIAFPTETVYGLGASIALPEAASRIYQIKGRDQSKALPLMLSDISQINYVADSVPEVAWLLVREFWPGPLTLVVTKSAAVPDLITSGSKTVAIRISSHPVAQAIVEELGAPITGTSANISGKPNPATAEEVRIQLGGKIDFIIDGGKCPGGIESTIIDVTKEVPVILREGAIPRQIIQTVCNVTTVNIPGKPLS